MLSTPANAGAGKAAFPGVNASLPTGASGTRANWNACTGMSSAAPARACGGHRLKMPSDNKHTVRSHILIQLPYDRACRVLPRLPVSNGPVGIKHPLQQFLLEWMPGNGRLDDV